MPPQLDFPRRGFRFGLGRSMWLDGIALAPDQADDFRLSTGEGSVDIGGAVYQGGTAGVEFRL